ncbi:MAG TPA: hypothetical protein VH186_37125 [Chloroflexia bacterium]|nr:hypothetical protein [Chloroflexia bacterium]
MTANQKSDKETISRRQEVIEILISYTPRPRIAREGFTRLGIFLGGALLMRWLAGRFKNKALAAISRLASNLLLGAGLFGLYAYRHPHRIPMGNAPDYIYSPVDGTVQAIEEISEEPLFLGGPAYRIEIASNLLSVPVQRTPLPGTVRYIYTQPKDQNYKLGLITENGTRLLLDMKPDSRSNLRLPSPLGEKEAILLRPEAGQSLGVTEHIGVRGFGVPTVTTLYLPTGGIDITGLKGMKVQAGKTILGRIKPA